MEWLDAPDQGVNSRAQLAIGPIDGDQTNILPLDPTLHLSISYHLLLFIPLQISA